MATDYTAIWDHEAQPKEYVRCNLCGEGRTLSFDAWDRYGYWQPSEKCAVCGLNFLNPRMTREVYAEFYASGAYRRLVSAFHGREINAQTIQPEQREYGQRLAMVLWPHVGRRYDLLDIGGSTGTVALELQAALQVTRATVMDPSPGELALCRAMTITSTIEEFQPDGRRWDLITMCQTADHLLDLMGSLRKIKGLLSPGGLFWSDIVDFDKTREVKIDHPFNLTERTYREFLKRAGFELLQVNYAPDGKHTGFLAR